MSHTERVCLNLIRILGLVGVKIRAFSAAAKDMYRDERRFL
jgi:hypothetical protein